MLLYVAHIDVDGSQSSHLNEIVQHFESLGARDVRCTVNDDCIHCQCYLPLDSKSKVLRTRGVLSVNLDTPASLDGDQE
jgi:hypothetical protein